jgi:hypothetical protein
VTADTPTALYEALAEKYHAKGKFPERDRFLILAADAAWNAGQPDAAEKFRQRILEFNPNHLLRPYPTFADALKSADILAYVQQLRRGYPRERALELKKELDQEARGAAPGGGERGAPGEAAGKSPGVFKMAPDPVARGEAARGTPREAAPPKLSQSHSLPADAGRPKTQPGGTAWQPSRAAPAVGTGTAGEPAAGAVIGTFLFLVVGIAALATFVYVFIWPFLS